MDQFDRAQQLDAENTEHAIAAARANVQKKLEPCGLCYNCTDPIAAGLTFCDGDCRDDYEHRKARGHA